MGRWQPDARGDVGDGRVVVAPLGEELHRRLPEAAARAGLTKRTFFRHFADKKEVLFSGGDVFQEAMTSALAAAPADATPLEAVLIALTAGAELIGGDHAHTRARQAIITAHPELQERELIKMARVGAALAAELRARGVDPTTATLAAEAGGAAFRVAFERWASLPASRKRIPKLATVVAESLAELQAVVGAA